LQKKKSYKIATLGCRSNQYESQAYRDQLEALGYHQATGDEVADICIVNTCTVTESADKDSRYQIRQLAREHAGARVVVTGCLAERTPDLLKEIEGVTDVVSNASKEALVASIFPEEDVPEFAIKHFEAHTRAFVKVQDGCNSFCTYCIIPYVRGRSRSRKVSEIVKEVETLIENGYKEIVLTGINIGDFDGGGSDRLSDLVRAVDQIPGLKRLRLSSIDPDEVDDDLAGAILQGKNTCPSMHVVLQSGSNVILKRMNRKYTRQVFLETAQRLRTANPDFTFTTDIIVGFPGETERDLQDTLEVMEEAKFAKVHMFPYSERARTRAALFPGKVAPEVIKERKQRVLRCSEQMSYQLREQYIGRTMAVLTEAKDERRPDLICGHTDNFLMVHFPAEQFQTNQIVQVQILENSAEGLKGVAVGGGYAQAH
jgi:threonylcarbamoyladenosine tRNA methylthiotransferase MtaB